MTELTLRGGEGEPPPANSDPGRGSKRRQGWRCTGGEHSYIKHDLIQAALVAQVSALACTRRHGLIIDLHAGDGKGHGTRQLAMPFEGDSIAECAASTASATLAVRTARATGSRVILCERNRERRQELERVFGEHGALVLGNHARLAEHVDPAAFPWVVVLSDPNGPKDQGVETMVWIARRNRFSDFVLTINQRAIKGHSALKPDTDDTGKGNERLLRGSRETRDRYTWMLVPERWRGTFGKKKAMISRATVKNPAFMGKVVLLTNYVGNLPKWSFEPW
jgi:hypothetical protein